MSEYRTIDGLSNNLIDEEYGSTDQAFLRITPYAYADGISAPAGADRPSAREVSNMIFTELEPVPNTQHCSDLFWLWGQFLDHDITLTPVTETAFPIQVPIGDSYFDPYGTGTEEIDLTRSAFLPGTGETTPGEQINEITAFIDASNVYGSDPERAEFLRDSDGKLKVSEGNLLPYNDGTQENAGGPSTNLFVAGDIRANENVGLSSMHTIFVREHNRLVDELKAEHPEYDAETLYQEARKIVGAEIQAITYNEFLPILLGPNALAEYSGYKADVDPQIANIFATAAYRLGHTMLSSQLYRVDESGNETEYGHLALRDAFFRPDRIVNEGGIDPIIRGAAMNVAQSLDTTVVDDVRNFLFGPPGSGGLDLAALNIQRGRDHGLADYNSARVAYGLSAVTSFSEITSDTELQQQLEALYGNVNNIDVFVGGLAEDTVAGSMLGELFQAVMVDQFTRLRDGDRFWYENDLSPEQIDMINQTTLADIILRNTDIEYMQHKMMIAYSRMDGSDQNDQMMGDAEHNLMMGHKGQDTLFGEDGDDVMYGGKGYDHLHGGNGDDVIYGEKGHDSIKAGHGNDKVHGGQGKDFIFGEAGDDTLEGDQGNDEIRGGYGDDELYGGNGADKLYGNQGNDILNGGEGKDILKGGRGDDIFVITPGTGKDIIKDFNPHADNKAENDKIDLKQYALTLEDILMTQHNNHVQLELPNHDIVVLQNVSSPQLLTEADFIL